MGIKLAEIMAKVFSFEIRFCHDSDDCLAALARACFSCRRNDLTGLVREPALRNFASATKGLRGLPFDFIVYLLYFVLIQKIVWSL